MSQKVGRPKTDKPKQVNYSIRIDLETETKLLEYCKEKKISKGEAIRRGIILLIKSK